jgi:acyl carrier protein phosphodiesterase
MNFLAHIYLSGDDPEVQLGNFMADAVKGNQYTQYELGIQRGIKLHRFIDSYTDTHPVFRRSKSRLHGKQFGHYTGVIMDMFYDHFLAANWREFHHQPLEVFTDNFYSLITPTNPKLNPLYDSTKLAHPIPEHRGLKKYSRTNESAHQRSFEHGPGDI